MPSPSDWTFELIETYFEHIKRTAHSYGLDTYPVQLELISAEQMLDAYASVGMPVNYRHWSFGKQFISSEKNYRRGHMGLAYEIVINSDPCIAYLMEENTMPMQALVMAHACFGHNSFFKGNYLFRMWTDASSIVDYLVYAKAYISECEERHGVDAVEEVLDCCHALMHYGVDRYRRPQKISMVEEESRRKDREAYLQQQVNDLWRTLPKTQGKQSKKEHRRFPEEPQENILYFIEKNAPLLEPWQREIVRIVRKIAQYFYPQRQTQVMNEGWATFWHYTLLNDHVRPGPAGRRLHDRVPELAHQRGVPAAGDASGLQRHQSLCAGLWHVHRPAAHLREADRRGPPVVPGNRRLRLAQDAGLRHASLQGRKLHRPVPVAAPDARVQAVLGAWTTQPRRNWKSRPSTTTPATAGCARRCRASTT